jgi:phospholipid-translocating ATPase
MLQIAMDTFHWNPIMHIFVWGSILSWLVVIPITSAPGLYGILGFFEYLGVAYEVIPGGIFWFYLPLATVIALLPTIIFRIVRLDVDPHIVDDVRLKQKKEGRRLFKRLKFHRKPVDSAVTRRATVKRTGYAYSHTEGFGDMITTGRIFGMDMQEVHVERRRRLSTIIGENRGGSIKAALAGTVTGIASAVATHGALQETTFTYEEKKEEKEKKREEISVEIFVEEREEEECRTDSPVGKGEEESKPQAEDSTIDSPPAAAGGELSAPDDTGSDHDSSTALLIPTKIDSSSDEDGGGGRKSNLIEVQGDTTDDRPVSMKLPGSVDSPSHDQEEESHDREEESVGEEGMSDDQKLLT